MAPQAPLDQRWTEFLHTLPPLQGAAADIVSMANDAAMPVHLTSVSVGMISTLAGVANSARQKLSAEDYGQIIAVGAILLNIMKANAGGGAQ